MKNRYGSKKNPTTGGYIKSNQESTFHGAFPGNAAEASVQAKGDDDSDASILRHGQSGRAIKQTRQYTVEYESHGGYDGRGEGEAIEMDDRTARRG